MVMPLKISAEPQRINPRNKNFNILFILFLYTTKVGLSLFPDFGWMDVKSLKYIIDASVTRHVLKRFEAVGMDVVHVLDLQGESPMKDREINLISIREDRIVMTKDYDFVESFMQSKRPYKLLFISSDDEAQWRAVFLTHFDAIQEHFMNADLVEIGKDGLVFH